MDRESFFLLWSPRIRSVLRVIVGLLFLEHGLMKLFAWPPSEMFAKPVEIMSLMGVAGVLEVVGGLLITVGLLTRITAFVLSGQMAAAYFMAHASQSVFPVLNGGEAAVLYCFVFLYFAVAGAGVWSLDQAFRSGSRNFVVNAKAAD
jgi:putative oxidoreductase